jgi:hypothetical protein
MTLPLGLETLSSSPIAPAAEGFCFEHHSMIQSGSWLTVTVMRLR